MTAYLGGRVVNLMEYVLFGDRVLIGLVFLFSAVGKVRGREAYSSLVAAVGELVPWSPPSRLKAVAPLVIAAELAVAGLLATPGTAVAGFGGAVALLAVFTVAIAAAVRSRRRVSCNCFGPSSAAVGPAHLIRNGVLLAVSLTGAVLASVTWSTAAEPGGVAAAALVGLVAAALVTLTDDIAELFRPVT